MGYGGCRDCKRCTEVALASLVLWPFRAFWTLCTFWNIGLIQRNCPQCGHKMYCHKLGSDVG